MKNIKFLILTLTLTLMTVSCESYDDYETDRDTIIGFVRRSNNINGVPEGGSKSLDIEIFVSDVSNVERTFDIVTLPIPDPETNPPTGAENYIFDSSVIIPPHERIGIITVTAVDVTITKERSYFMLGIKEGNNHIVGGTTTIAVRN